MPSDINVPLIVTSTVLSFSLLSEATPSVIVTFSLVVDHTTPSTSGSTILLSVTLLTFLTASVAGNSLRIAFPVLP